ncbi:MAG: hypothetical protein K9M17_05965 [Mariprofundaceae bacterium]|nr:hypothetical protein [Mariprofundaceae bacterium]
MKLMRGNRNRWSMAFTLVFTVQLLASTLCVVSSAQAAEVIKASHCHEAIQHDPGQHVQHGMGIRPMQPQSEQLPMSACSHCASPENFALFVNDLDASPADLLFAFVVLETYATAATAASLNFIKRSLAPPRSSTTLYTTTQRIRI